MLHQAWLALGGEAGGCKSITKRGRLEHHGPSKSTATHRCTLANTQVGGCIISGSTPYVHAQPGRSRGPWAVCVCCLPCGGVGRYTAARALANPMRLFSLPALPGTWRAPESQSCRRQRRGPQRQVARDWGCGRVRNTPPPCAALAPTSPYIHRHPKGDECYLGCRKLRFQALVRYHKGRYQCPYHTGMTYQLSQR